MIPLLDRRRARLLAGLLAIALIQLAASVMVAQALHGGGGAMLIWAGAAALAGFACEATLRRMAEGLGLDYTTAIREALFRHLMAIDPALVAQRRHGAMLQSFVGDLTALRQWVAEGIMRGVLALVALTGLLAWLALTHPALGLVAAVIVLAACAAGLAVLPPLSRAVREVRRERGRVAAFASERLTASATVQACGRIGPEARRLSRRVARLNRAALRRAWLTGLLRALPHLATSATIIAALLVAGPGGASGLAGSVLVIGLVGLALRDLARAAELAIPGRISQRRIEGLLALPKLRRPPAQTWVRGETRALVLDRLVLGDGCPAISARAEAGDIVLLSGDGAMRRALLTALAGLQMPQSGGMRWNGAELAARPPSRRRRIVGLASADLPLVAGSNRLNLRYRAPHADEIAVDQLASAWGIDLSGHDAPPQRLALARALLGTPPLLAIAPDAEALDEADIARIARAAAAWHGVVLLSGSAPWMARLANRHWRLDDGGLHDEPRLPIAALIAAKERTA